MRTPGRSAPPEGAANGRRPAVVAAVWLLLASRLAADPYPLTGLSGTYTQPFDTLAAAGADVAWTNGATLPGWFAFAHTNAILQYTAADGASGTGNLYGFGSNNVSDRALGSIGSNLTGDFRWGLLLRNDTTETLTNLQVAFTGEQWRNSGAATQALAFGYVNAADAPTPASPGYRTLTQLVFASPVAGGAAGPLDGNAGANRSRRMGAFPVVVPPGHHLLLRWHDPNHAGDDHGLAVDDLEVAWLAGAAPPDGLAVPLAGTQEAFDCLGTDPDGGLPEHWRADKSTSVRSVGAYDAATNTTERSGGTNLASNAANGIYNFGAGDAAAAGDRAVGGLASGEASKSVNVYVKCRNRAGHTVTRWRVRYRVEKYRRGDNPAGFGVQLHASTNGTNWAAAGPATLFAADDVTAGYAVAPGVCVAEERIVPLAVPDGAAFFLAWNVSVAGGTSTSSAQALSLDDVDIRPWFPATLLILR